MDNRFGIIRTEARNLLNNRRDLPKGVLKILDLRTYIPVTYRIYACFDSYLISLSSTSLLRNTINRFGQQAGDRNKTALVLTIMTVLIGIFPTMLHHSS